jgi:hypothetical protein
VAPRQTLTSTDFSSAPASTAVAVNPPPAVDVKTTPTASEKPVPHSTTSTEALDVVATPGPPTLSKEEPKAVRDSVLVDATVGEVNGRPVTVSGLLEPLGARLRAISQDKSVTRAEWRKTAVWAIGTSIKGMVEDELLRAEAMASFSPEQRQGFLAFIEDMTRKFRSENLGAIEVANKRLQENEGRTIDEWRRDTEIKELVSFQLYKKAYGQVQVSKRDTEVYYENNIDEYRPRAKAHFRRISVKATDTQAVDEVTRRLAAGEPFAAVASGPFNSLAGSEAGLYIIELKGDRATAEFWRSKEINKAAQTMEPGTVVGPLEIEGSPATKQWLFLETIDQPKGLEWYDAQLPIERELRVAGRGTCGPGRR